MPCLTSDQIKQAKDQKVERVDVPEWGEGAYLFVRIIATDERSAFEQGHWRGEGEDRKVDLGNMRSRFVAMVACTEDGTRLFSDDDIEALGQKSNVPMERIFDAGRALNCMLPDSLERAEKNSAPTVGAGLPTV